MNNTRKITIALDSTAIQKHVCAESACIALMSDIDHTEILTPDHRALLQLYAHDAFLSLAAGIASAVDESAFSVPCPDASLFQLPLSVSADSQCSAKQLLALAEKYVACAVLASATKHFSAYAHSFPDHCSPTEKHIATDSLPSVNHINKKTEGLA